MESPTVCLTADIAAPVERVWELVSDISVMPRFSAELQSVAWIDGGSPTEGACFVGTNRHEMMGVWTTRSQIVACIPPRQFAWAVGDPAMPAATWRFDLVAVDGSTRLSYTACIGPGRSGVSMAVDRMPNRRDEIVAGRLRQFEANMAATLAGIKALAEAPGPSAADLAE